MPRLTWTFPGVEGTAASGAVQPFNVCRHCVDEPVMLNAVIARKLGVDQDKTPKVEFQRASHRPFDFSPTPIACAACGRVLGAEDD